MIDARRAVAFVVPGRLDTPTGGYIYDRHVVDGLRDRGWTVDVRELDASFPHPTTAARAHAASTLASLPDDALVIVDGLGLGALPEEVRREATRLRLIGFVHLPLADEAGLPEDVARSLRTSERNALAGVRRVVVPSTGTRTRLVERYGVAADRVSVIEPGTDPAPAANGSGDDLVHLLCVATLTPRKGHVTLFRALAAVPTRHWVLTCAGSADRDPAHADRLHALARELHLEAQIRFIGNVDQETLARYYARADAFVLATVREGFRMAICEALAHALPVVSTSACGVQDVIRDAAGILVGPDDVPALTQALTTVIGDAQARARLAAGARRVRSELPDWPSTVQQWEELLLDVQP
jgi:glycosyltransferase involved in cell wall biosynthesis